MQILGCLFMILFAGFFILLSLGFSVLDGILRLFGGKRRPTTFQNETPKQTNAESTKAPHKKFSDVEGEYVDFEEIK